MLGGNRGFNCEDCETDWFLGVAGICLEDNQTCLCPEGYSGRDDWVITQTCHVNESAVLTFHKFIFSVCLLAVLTNIYSLFQVLKSYSTNKTLFSGKLKYIFKFTVVGFILFFFQTLIFATYFGIYALSPEKVSFVDYKLLLPALFGLGVFMITTSHSIFFYTWFKSLPDIKSYGHLLNYPSYILKYPNLVPCLGIFSCSMYFISMFIIFIILPVLDIIAEKEEENANADEGESEVIFGQSVAIYFWPVITFAFLYNVFYPVLTIVSLIKLYQGALNMTTSDELDEGMSSVPSGKKIFNPLKQHEKPLRKVIFALKIFTVIIIIYAPIQTILNIFCWSLGGFYQYIFSSGSILCLMIIAIIAPITTLKNTRGGMMPLIEFNNSEKNQKQVWKSSKSKVKKKKTAGMFDLSS